jgi:hypothetical protein
MDRAPAGSCWVKTIDEVYGRWTRTPEAEPLKLEAFFAEVAALPKAAVASQREPNLSQTVDRASAAAAQSTLFARHFGDFGAPAGSRTRT